MPAVIVALTQGWEKALIVGLVIIGMQSLENWVLVPRVMRGAVGLTPLTVFVAILTGTQFMGVTGAILAIPIAAGIQVILTDYFSSRLLRREPQQQSGWRWMLNRAGARDDEGPAPNPDLSPGNNSQAYTATNQTISSDVMLRPNPPSPEPPIRSEPPPAQGTPDRDRSVPAGRQAGWAPFGPEASPDVLPNERRNEPERDDS